MDIAVVSKDGYHNKNEISIILSKCMLHMDQRLDIYYRPNLNKDLQERGFDAIWTSNKFWGDEETWPTKENYQPLELWYLVENKIQIKRKLWPLEKHIERVLDGLTYSKPLLLNNYIKEEKYYGSTS